MSGLITEGARDPVWLDGALVEWNDARLHVASFGLNNASCVFDGIRVYNGVPFALPEHCSRLADSARAIGMDLSFHPDQIARAVLETIAVAGHPEAYVRPIAWHGSEVVGISSAGASVHLAIIVLPWRTPAAHRADGVVLTRSRWARPPANTGPVTAKASCNYALGTIAHREAVSAGFDDALLLDYRGYVAEATGANIFVVTEGMLRTPIADAFLSGITRGTVIRLAREHGLDVVEARIRPRELAAAAEIFLTGTAAEIQPVRAVDDIRLPAERPITTALTHAYRHATRPTAVR